MSERKSFFVQISITLKYCSVPFISKVTLNSNLVQRYKLLELLYCFQFIDQKSSMTHVLLCFYRMRSIILGKSLRPAIFCIIGLLYSSSFISMSLLDFSLQKMPKQVLFSIYSMHSYSEIRSIERALKSGN